MVDMTTFLRLWCGSNTSVFNSSKDISNTQRSNTLNGYYDRCENFPSGFGAVLVHVILYVILAGLPHVPAVQHT